VIPPPSVCESALPALVRGGRTTGCPQNRSCDRDFSLREIPRGRGSHAGNACVTVARNGFSIWRSHLPRLPPAGSRASAQRRRRDISLSAPLEIKSRSSEYRKGRVIPSNAALRRYNAQCTERGTNYAVNYVDGYSHAHARARARD